MANTTNNGKPLPSQEVLLALFRYEPETGRLFWRERPNCNVFNAKFAHKEAFTSDCGQGYRQGRIYGCLYYAHRVILKMTYGPIEGHVDHINGIRSDNRLVNLRSVSRSENQRNLSLPSTNTSGVIGVTWRAEKGKWRAQIKVGGKNYHLGYAETVESAVVLRKAAEKKFGFHPNHGKPSINTKGN